MDSPFSVFLVPLGAFLVAIVAIVAGAFNSAHARRLKAEQRMAMIARGLPAADIETLLSGRDGSGEVRDPMRSLANARRTAVVLISVGLSLVVFFVALAAILQVRPVLVPAAAGLLVMTIGLGFVVDYHLQKREMARFGLEIGGRTEIERL